MAAGGCVGGLGGGGGHAVAVAVVVVVAIVVAAVAVVVAVVVAAVAAVAAVVATTWGVKFFFFFCWGGCRRERRAWRLPCAVGEFREENLFGHPAIVPVQALQGSQGRPLFALRHFELVVILTRTVSMHERLNALHERRV